MQAASGQVQDVVPVHHAAVAEDGAQLVVILFFRQLPRNTYRQWRRDLSHDELARWLLSDPAAIPTLRETIGNS